MYQLYIYSYCMANSSRPSYVPEGSYGTGTAASTDATRSNYTLAPRGSYAVAGLLYVCPAGRYGASAGLADNQCSGACR